MQTPPDPTIGAIIASFAFFGIFVCIFVMSKEQNCVLGSAFIISISLLMRF
jgi:hypothetical protein